MNETSPGPQAVKFSKFVWRRLEEPLQIGSWELPPQVWVFLLLALLAVALFYVVWMYVKDSKGIGLGWATLLGGLRLSVYALLAWVFLLPSKQQFTETTSPAKVIALFDISDSMHESDEIPQGKPNEKLRTRMDQVLNFLNDPKVNFISNLEKKNPVTAYRFGTRVDPESIHFADGQVMTREEKEKTTKNEAGPIPTKEMPDDLTWVPWYIILMGVLSLGAMVYIVYSFIKEIQSSVGWAVGLGALRVFVLTVLLCGASFYLVFQIFRAADAQKKADSEGPVATKTEAKPLPQEYWQAWLTPKAQIKDAAGLDDKEAARLGSLAKANDVAVKSGLTRGTNLGESLLAVVNKEINSRVQGIVVFTDGRSNEGSNTAFAELETRLKAARIPLLVVGVGEDRQKVKQQITELRLPQVIQPDDKFRVVADITGEGLAGKKLDVTLEIVHAKTVKAKVKGKDGKVTEQETEELLPIKVIEAEDPNDPKAKRIEVSLGTKLTLKPSADVFFDKSNPPRAEVEWQLDAVAIAAAAKVDLNQGEYKGKKWEIGQTQEDSDLKFRVRIPTDPREGLGLKKFHETDPSLMKVVKKPVRVLLMAAAANRDYQFVRTLLVRETEKKRLELAIHLQLPPGEIKRRVGVVQDVPPERLLATFPETLGQKKGDLYDLSSYDVIVAFDPDWKQLTEQQIKNIQLWSEKGGGLVLIGGYINTFELTRPLEGANAERYKPILDILPVVLDDSRERIERKTDDPWDLDFAGATAEMEFLKLDEDLDESKFKEDWKAFFFGTGAERTPKPQRGFYNFYPVQKAKPGALVVARFMDPAAKLSDGTTHPYLVMNPDQLARVIWIGSAETWRLREYKEEFHERFWTKLVRYAASKSKGGGTQAIKIEMARTFTANRFVDVEARIDLPNGMPLDRNAKPEIRLQMPAGVPESEIRQPVIMAPRPGARDGWFSGRFQVRSPGEYELTIKVPRQAGQDSEMTQSQKFLVRESNPELDNIRPDFARMFRISSEADDVLPRMDPADRTELKRRLSRPKVEAENPENKEEKSEIRDDKLRLYFDLGNAGLVPSCMLKDVQTQTSLGETTDLYNEDIVDLMYRVGVYKNKEGKAEPPSRKERPPEKKMFSWVLMLVVFLFSMEWLIRKLLRLA